MSSSSEDSSNDSDTQSPDDRTVSDSDPGSVYPGHSQSNADARDSDWETEDENYEDLSDTEFHTPGESEESALFSRYSGRCDKAQPTIKLSDFVVELAHDVLTKGKVRNQKDWDRLFRSTSRSLPPSTRSCLRISSWWMYLTNSNTTSVTKTSLNTIRRRGVLSKTCGSLKGLCLP